MASAALGSAYRHLKGLFGSGSVVGLGDGQLLARYSSSKDEAAFEALVTRHGPMVLATCRAILKNEQDVEDAFQATFLVLAKKAHSVRGGDALGGWLHRVAYRAAIEASMADRRRRKKEAEASAMAPLDASRPGFESEWKPILHEEINRLPEGHRLPVVLCDLEGLTYEEAADRLRWTVPTLRCRLAKARQQLKGRLTRRGVTALSAGVGASLVPKGASAAVVPASLLRSTIAAATGGSASSGVVLLTDTLLRGMLMTKLKIASTAALAALALGTAGYYAAGAGRPDEPKPAMKPKAMLKAMVAPKEAPAGKKPIEMVEIKGRVMSPDGKPVAGAAVRGAYVYREATPLPSATSGPDGRFTIRIPKPGDNGAPLGPMSEFPWIIAVAPGHGVGWANRVLRPDRPSEQIVTLTEGGAPIEGRIMDLEGRPVTDAKVKVARVWYAPDGNLAGWLAKSRNGAAGALWQGLQDLPLDQILEIETKTGPDGRFKLDGVGRERIADLIVSGPGVATTQVNVLCRDEPAIQATNKMMMTPTPFIIHAPRFQLAMAPSKRVEGIARDKDTGKPIANLKIQAAAFEENSMIPAVGVHASTDAEGRYRIDGLPKASAYRLFVAPEPGLPYLKASIKAPADSPALEPVAFDFALKRAMVIRGRVTDKVTGKPVRGHADYFTFEDNPNLGDYPGFLGSYNSQVYPREDGTFEMVALPGRGLICIRSDQERHRAAIVMAEKIPGYDAGFTGFHTLPEWCHVGNYHIIAEVNLDPKAEPGMLEFQADPGRSASVEVVGPDGQPMGGTVIKGRSELFLSETTEEASTSFEVHALDPARPRRVIVLHAPRKLIGSAVLKGDEPGPVTIQLVPWGTVAGRIVDDEGKPRKNLLIGSAHGNQNPHPETEDILPGGDIALGIAVGDDGLFRIEPLIPGVKYNANARSGFEAYGDLFKDLTLAPGEVKDLGDLKVQAPKKTEE